MALVEFSEQLVAADSVLDLARRLGERCLASSEDLKAARGRPTARRELTVIEKLAGQTSLRAWAAAVERPAAFERRLGTDLVTAVKHGKTFQPLDFLGVLRGLCRGPLIELFEATSARIELAKGMPVPFPDRPLPWETTTKPETLHDADLLAPYPFDLYNHIPGEEPRIILDFSLAERLDAVTWNEDKRLPLIATLHPKGGGELVIARQARGRFFGVQPALWDIEAIKSLLARARAAGARVAVLPELSLPSPDALEGVLAASPGSYPEIVVAGSAHHEAPGAKGRARIRANESRVYLDGKCVAVAHKHKAFRFRKLGIKRYRQTQWEDLSNEPKTITVLSGRNTRLAVAICADLQETMLPRLLEDAGVNLLAAPSMTPKIGSFTPSISGIAGHCQGVAVVANTRWDNTGEPFLCMCAVPRPHPSEQLDAQAGDGREPAPELAILDPNKPLPGAVKWQR
jgi:predicted amidohydrolase